METFPNSNRWWIKDASVLPRCLAWSDNNRFHKTDYDELLGMVKTTKTPYETRYEHVLLCTCECLQCDYVLFIYLFSIISIRIRIHIRIRYCSFFLVRIHDSYLIDCFRKVFFFMCF